MKKRLLGMAILASLFVVPGMWVEMMGAEALKRGVDLARYLIFLS